MAIRLSPDEDDLLAIKKMDETYKKFVFPEGKGTTIFYATSIYLRKPQDSTSDQPEPDSQNPEQKEHASEGASHGKHETPRDDTLDD